MNSVKSKSIVHTILLPAVLLAGGLLAAGDAQAQYCEGTVHGLGSRYNPATGQGFLAVRTGPTSRAAQVGELFNGDKVEIFRRKRNWYRIAPVDGGPEGWAHARYIRNDCRY